jgi:large subunit ribosomal protein L10
MVRSIFLLSLGAVATSAFMGQPIVSRTAAEQSSLYMGGAGGYSSSLPGKKEKVSKVQGLLETSEMVFACSASSITVSQAQRLRRSLPEGSYVTVVKNTIMKRAIEGSEFEAAGSMMKGANMWFFIEEDIGGTIKAWKTFVKETGKMETHNIFGGVIEGTYYDQTGVEAIGQLPTKDELYAQIAGAVKAVPTKVARVIKAPNSKLARAIKLATMPEDE